MLAPIILSGAENLVLHQPNVMHRRSALMHAIYAQDVENP